MRYLDSNNEYAGLTSRYKILRVVEDEGDTYLETYNQVLVPVSPDDSYHIVEHKEVNRLDLIAIRYYSSPSFWWAIALANNLIDPFVINEGVMLRIPSIATLDNFNYRILTR